LEASGVSIARRMVTPVPSSTITKEIPLPSFLIAPKPVSRQTSPDIPIMGSYIVTPALANRVRFETYRGHRVLVINYAHCDVEGMKRVIDECRRIVGSQLPGSVLTLSDVTGATFDSQVVESIKELSRVNAPFVKRGAIVGITGLQSFIYSVVQAFSKRQIPLFDSREAALKYLTED
jgi:predicted aconitase with swiveling domain